jgi:hypothetical protein
VYQVINSCLPEALDWVRPPHCCASAQRQAVRFTGSRVRPERRWAPARYTRPVPQAPQRAVSRARSRRWSGSAVSGSMLPATCPS